MDTVKHLLGRAVLVAVLMSAGCGEVMAASLSKAVLAALEETQRVEIAKVDEARAAFQAELDAYWKKSTEKRSVRRAKRKKGNAATAEDYVATQPPEYAGPVLSSELQALIDKLQAEEAKANGETEPPKAAEQLPGVADFLEAAIDKYGFSPDLVSEAEYKRRYAREALAHGLTRDQIVRVYSLETGGQGTYDMQSGINPVTRKGKPISTAIGYAQLLGANTVGELGTYGSRFVERLLAMAAADGVAPERAEALKAKAAILQRMVKDARAAGGEWSRHVAYARTERGKGMHAVNLDGDIGPWLQVNKLLGLKTSAAKFGFADLTGGQLELMNLAGPGSGLEMMSPVAQGMPTSNFFERGGYYRNPVVQKRTAAELLAKLDERIEFYIVKPEAVAFAAIFDELSTGVPAQGAVEAAPAAGVKDRR